MYMGAGCGGGGAGRGPKRELGRLFTALADSLPHSSLSRSSGLTRPRTLTHTRCDVIADVSRTLVSA